MVVVEVQPDEIGALGRHRGKRLVILTAAPSMSEQQRTRHVRAGPMQIALEMECGKVANPKRRIGEDPSTAETACCISRASHARCLGFLSLGFLGS